MRVFLDTNVWLAAFRARGLCADLLEWLLDHETLLTSQSVIAEVQDKLAEKFGLSQPTIRAIGDFLEQHCEVVVAPDDWHLDFDDPDDIPILGAALAGRAEVFVTGDRALIALAHVEGMRILSPRAYWNAYVA